MSVAYVGLFGGARVQSAGVEVSPPNTRASLLLAALVLARGALVSSVELKALMWPSGEPASAANQVHRLVGQVRRLFEPDLPSRDVGEFIAGSNAGYRLDTSRVRSDVEECDLAVARARELRERAEWSAAVEHYVVALQTLRQPLLGDVAWESAGHAGFAGIARMRVAVAHQALDSARDGDRLDQVVGLVEEIAGRMPFEEALQARLIRALTHVGRRRDAMSLYETVRTQLVHELGVDPGPELRAAHEELLKVGEAGPVSVGTTAADASTVRPAQLPAALRRMTAQPAAQELLDQVARQGDAEAVVITSIGGMGGIGKTTLAIAWAGSLAPRFPDGQLYVDLRGFDPSGQVMEPMDALGDLLLSLGAPTVMVEESLDARSGRFRSLVSDKRLLLLLDNARDAEQVRPLLPNSPHGLVIVTSRNQLSSLVVREGAVPVRLDRMTDEQARDLLAHRLGDVRLGLEPAAVDRIVAAAAGLPLALAIVAARIAIDPDVGLAAVADELAGMSGDGPRGLLSGWSAGGPSDGLAAVFDWSYQLLDADTSRVFRLLAVHPGLEVPLRALASVIGLDVPEARKVTSALVGVSLLERRGPERFVMHDLLREYAVGRLTELERDEAEVRLVGHYVRSTRNAWSVFGRPPVGDLDGVAELPLLQPEPFESISEATSWYIRERTVLRDVLQLAVERGLDRAAANIAIDWRPMNQSVDADVYTYPHAMVALAAAERTDDAVLSAELHRDVGPKAVRLGHPKVGQDHLERARALFASLGDRGGEANTLRNLAALATVPRDIGLGHLRAAAALLEGGEAPQVLEVVRVTLATLLLDVGPDEAVSREDCQEAEGLLRESLPVLLDQGWTYVIPSAANTLAIALMRLSRPREALDAALHGMSFAEADPLSHALLHVRVAEAALATGERSIAQQACRDFHSLVEAEGRGHVDRMLATAHVHHPDNDLFGRVEQLEETLARS